MGRMTYFDLRTSDNASTVSGFDLKAEIIIIIISNDLIG